VSIEQLGLLAGIGDYLAGKLVEAIQEHYRYFLRGKGEAGMEKDMGRMEGERHAGLRWRC
jgi:hypothetical protein